jgi:adenine phosphoribosyltransferase
VWPFRRKPLLDAAMTDWMFEQAEWLLTEHRHRAAFAKAQLLPLSEKAFPSDGASGHALAKRMLEHVLRYSGAPLLQVRLIASAESARYKQEGLPLRVEPKATAAGTYRRGAGVCEITYDAALLAAPADLIAVLAHEVAHAVLDFGVGLPPPGDAAFEEMRTDFTAAFLGFGLFLAQFRADGRIASPEAAQEWKRLFMYYMNLREICFATALFCMVRGVDPKPALRRAPGAAAPHLKRAFADVALEPHRIAALRSHKASAARVATGAQTRAQSDRPAGLSRSRRLRRDSSRRALPAPRGSKGRALFMTAATFESDLKAAIRSIPDYPKAGIMFRDITTLLGDARAFRQAVDQLVQPWAGSKIDKVAGIEARGFILGGAVAHQVSAGFIPIRKKGKLPFKRVSVGYSLEYGMDEMEMHEDALARDERVILVDDLVATGGTAEAAVKLLRQMGGNVLAACFVIDLPELGGAEKLRKLGVPVRTLVSFAGH